MPHLLSVSVRFEKDIIASSGALEGACISISGNQNLRCLALLLQEGTTLRDQTLQGLLPSFVLSSMAMVQNIMQTFL